RVVKPACADGTAVMWESMSSPFFEKPYPKRIGFFVYKEFLICTLPTSKSISYNFLFCIIIIVNLLL
ncbi:hypothetical protein SD960_05165, partial [Flavobacterium sp. MMLR14_040]|uniref:hypothetical protein n=1 Tax=Flavobacterium sp. MMLR14_040 TaxID=3093843 RepID=UPI00298FAECD